MGKNTGALELVGYASDTRSNQHLTHPLETINKKVLFKGQYFRCLRGAKSSITLLTNYYSVFHEVNCMFSLGTTIIVR